MSTITVTPDTENHSITIVAEFDAPRSRVWEIYTKPELLQRWWGPPGCPAVFERLDLTIGGRAEYYMTSAEGEKYPGVWQFVTIEAEERLVFDDSFASDDYTIDESLPTSRNEYEFTDLGGRTRIEGASIFPSAEALQQSLDMGTVEGLRSAMGQIDDLLAA